MDYTIKQFVIDNATSVEEVKPGNRYEDESAVLLAHDCFNGTRDWYLYFLPDWAMDVHEKLHALKRGDLIECGLGDKTVRYAERICKDLVIDEERDETGATLVLRLWDEGPQKDGTLPF